MPPRRCFPRGSSEAAFCGVLQGRRGDACRWARPRRAFCGVLQGRLCDASRWARPRRLSAGFSNGGAARSAAVPFCPSLPRRPGNGCRAPVPAHANRRAVPTLFHIFPRARVMLLPLPCRPANDTAHGRRGDARRRARLRRLSAGFSNGGAARSAAVPFCPSLPRRPGNGCRAPVPAHANRRAVPTLFHIFPRARVMLLPLPCRPANDTAHGRRGDARRRARLRRPSTGFCRVAEAMLPDGLV